MMQIEARRSDGIVWYYGAPPDIGWWPASTCYNPWVLRYWDGVGWSVPNHYSRGKDELSLEPESQYGCTQVVWSKRWW